MPKKPLPVPKAVYLGTVRSRDVHPQDIRVLVVNDDDRTRALVVGRLQHNDFPVTGADGIASGLESLRRAPVDVVVIDMEMPNPEGSADEAGLVLLRALSEFNPKPAAVVFTPGGSQQHRQAARALGSRGFLTKRRDLRNLPMYVAHAWSLDHPMPETATGT